MLALKLCRRPERVADLVHHDFLDRLAQEFLGELELLLVLGWFLALALSSFLSFVVLLILVGDVGGVLGPIHRQGKRGESHLVGLGGGVVASRGPSPGPAAVGAGPGSGPSRRGRRRGPAVYCRSDRIAVSAAPRGAQKRRLHGGRAIGARRRHGLPVSVLHRHDRADDLADGQRDRTGGSIDRRARPGRGRASPSGTRIPPSRS